MKGQQNMLNAVHFEKLIQNQWNNYNQVEMANLYDRIQQKYNNQEIEISKLINWMEQTIQLMIDHDEPDIQYFLSIYVYL